MRYLLPPLIKDLQKKMVILCGPRQVGKTTLTKFLIRQEGGVYLNWDIRADQRTIRELSWPKDPKIVVFDEIHKYLQWKNFLKGVYDAWGDRQSFLITGSARLETFRKQGDALTGRYYHFRLHPIDLVEANKLEPDVPVEKHLQNLMKTGGFPEAFYNPPDAERLRNNRFDIVLQEDLRDLSKTNSLRGISLLIELLRERVGSIVNYQNLAEDISVSAPTIKNWIELLQRLYIVFLVPPFSRQIKRSLKKDSKLYFYDCASAYNGEGAVLENAVACSLLKYCHYREDVSGERHNLFFYRDREKREVDFVVEKGRRVHWIIEVKLTEKQLSKNLLYLKERVDPQESLQLVKEMDSSEEREQRGVKVVSLIPWVLRNLKLY